MANSEHGGARTGAGRKTKALEDDLHDRLKKALKDGRKNRLDDIFEQLIKDSLSPLFKVRHASRAMLFDRLYGKAAPPRPEDGEDEGEGGTFIVRVPVRMSAEEWKLHVTKSQAPSSQPQ